MKERSERIEFYLDFTSPYAYLASTQIVPLAERYERMVIWRPFLIGATFKVTGRKAPVEHPLLREYMFYDVLRTARLLQQPLNFPAKFPILSVKPARLFYYLEDRDGNQEMAIAFAHEVFKAYFVEGRDISLTETLADIIAPFGLSEARTDEILGGPELKARFREVVETAIKRGVFGAPMFIVDQEMFWGVDHLDQLERWLRTGGW